VRHNSNDSPFYFRVFRVFRGSIFFMSSVFFGAVNTNLIYESESYQIIGACFEVYREKGCGFLEPVYQECMEIELRLRGVSFVPQKTLALEYKGCPLRSKYEPDFICYEKIIVELKAASQLAQEHRAQVQNYLKATGFKLGLLVNFGHYPKVQMERIVAERGRYDYGG
jgi:GxxExxY protein